MKILVFGTGKTYQKNKELIVEKDSIVGFLDNDLKKIGQVLDNTFIHTPDDVKILDYDIVLLMSMYVKDIYKQLVQLDVPQNKIWFWGQYCNYYYKGDIKEYYHSEKFANKKRVLIITGNLIYCGGAMEAVYTCEAFTKAEYDTVLAAPEGETAFIDEMVSRGINIALCKSLVYPSEFELHWFKQFDLVIVNSTSMIRCAFMANKSIHTILWLHEPLYEYEKMLIEHQEFCKENDLKQLNISTVSHIADNNFHQFFPTIQTNNYYFGIPDCKVKSVPYKDKFVFALIGYVNEVKGQDIFLKAALKFADKYQNNIEFWLIGKPYDNDYNKSINQIVKSHDNIKSFGLLKREQVEEIYKNIDVVVCASREETMSIVVMEGMMNEKVCITSDSTGISRYIQNGINGYVFHKENIEELYSLMKEIYDKKENIKNLKKAARDTYEKEFSINAYSKRLDVLFKETVNNK